MIVSPILSLLNDIRGRPLAIFVGKTSLCKFADFLRGYEHAVQTLGHQTDHLLADFRDWVQMKYKNTKESWENLIVHHSADETDAVRRFWLLLDEFLAQQTPKPERILGRPQGEATAMVQQIK